MYSERHMLSVMYFSSLLKTVTVGNLLRHLKQKEILLFLGTKVLNIIE
jgi:hypothetical protein